MAFVDFYKNISWLYQKLRILSIDIVLGALSGGIMAAKVFDAQPVVVWWFVLALAVWIIYTADHLIDANKLKDKAASKRRYFYFKNFRIVVIIEFFLIGLTAFLSFWFFDKKTIYFGVAMVVFVTVYLLLVQIKGSEKQVWLQKELIVAIVYTVGIWAVPVLESPEIRLPELMILVSFFITVWADILLIAFFEIKNDRQDGFVSLPILIGKKKSALLIKLLFALSVIITFFLLFFQNGGSGLMLAEAILFFMNVVLFLSLKYKIYFRENERYRIIAETVFLLPAVMFFF